ncbi:MAG: DUF2069 domain-containing protein [Rubrivivax sp.]
MTDPARPTPAVQRLRAASIALTAALVLLGLAWELWLAPTGRGTLALKVLPLVVALPGLARHRLYTYRWLSLAVWLYAAEGAVRAASERGISQALGAVEVVLVLALFATLGAYVRSRLRAGREVAA